MAELIAFPQSRRIGKARRVAGVWLRRRTERARDRYWSETVGSLRSSLQRLGFDETEIDAQLVGFSLAVEVEIGLIAAGTSHPGPTPQAFVEAHRIIDEGMGELFHDGDNPPGVA